MLLILLLKQGEQTDQLEIMEKKKLKKTNKPTKPTVTWELGKNSVSHLQTTDLLEVFTVSTTIGKNHKNLGSQPEGPLQTSVPDD